MISQIRSSNALLDATSASVGGVCCHPMSAMPPPPAQRPLWALSPGQKRIHSAQPWISHSIPRASAPGTNLKMLNYRCRRYPHQIWQPGLISTGRCRYCPSQQICPGNQHNFERAPPIVATVRPSDQFQTLVFRNSDWIIAGISRIVTASVEA